MLGYSPAMHKFKPLLLAALLANGCLAGSACAQAPLPPPRAANPPARIAMPDAALRGAFEAATRGTLDANALAAYANQPLAGWLEYAALRNGFASLPPERGAAFLAKYRGQVVADAFRKDWLAALARRKDWNAFLASWDSGIDADALKCAQLNAKLALGRTDAEWSNEALALWRGNGKSLPGDCDAPFAQLAAQGKLTDALRWERIDQAIAEVQPGVIRSIAKGLTGADAAQANAYAAYLDAPTGDVGAWPKTARSRQAASRALAKLAKAAPDRAEALLPGIAQTLGMNEDERGRVLYQVALWSVASYLPESARRLAAVPLSAYDANLHEWQAREAMARSDWRAALAAIRRMPDAQRNDSRWTWFAARTSELIGDAAGAKA